jgi:hypothetical protein
MKCSRRILIAGFVPLWLLVGACNAMNIRVTAPPSKAQADEDYSSTEQLLDTYLNKKRLRRTAATASQTSDQEFEDMIWNKPKQQNAHHHKNKTNKHVEHQTERRTTSSSWQKPSYFQDHPEQTTSSNTKAYKSPYNYDYDDEKAHDRREHKSSSAKKPVSRSSKHNKSKGSKSKNSKSTKGSKKRKSNKSKKSKKSKKTKGHKRKSLKSSSAFYSEEAAFSMSMSHNFFWYSKSSKSSKPSKSKKSKGTKSKGKKSKGKKSKKSKGKKSKKSKGKSSIPEIEEDPDEESVSMSFSFSFSYDVMEDDGCDFSYSYDLEVEEEEPKEEEEPIEEEEEAPYTVACPGYGSGGEKASSAKVIAIQFRYSIEATTSNVEGFLPALESAMMSYTAHEILDCDLSDSAPGVVRIDSAPVDLIGGM